MRKALIFLLALVMIPVFLGTFCPCAMAAPSDGLVFQKAACHGCCPEMQAGDECQSVIRETPKFSTLPPSFKVPNDLKALNPGESRDIAINRRAWVPAGDEPSLFSETPLYISIRVLRI